MRIGTTISNLVRELKEGTKDFFREEVQLAKTELLEKLTGLGKNAGTIAVGGFIAHAGLIILLGGLGALLAYGFQSMGLDVLMAAFLGFAIIGVAVVIGGATALALAIKAIKKQSLAPEKTIETIRHIQGSPSIPEPSSAQVLRQTAQRTHAIQDTDCWISGFHCPECRPTPGP